LFFASVAVVDCDEESALNAGRNAIHVLLRSQRRFDAFVGFGMDGVAIEKFHLLGGRLRPSFDETTVARVDAEGTFLTENLDWQSVEEFVGEDDGWCRAGIEGTSCRELRLSRFKVTRDILVDPFAQGR